MRKHFTEVALERSSSDLCLATIVKIIHSWWILSILEFGYLDSARHLMKSDRIRREMVGSRGAHGSKILVSILI